MNPDLLKSFAAAVVTISFPDGARVLQPQPSGHPGIGFPFDRAVHIVTAYNPSGHIDDEVSNAARHRLLLDHVEALGVETLPTVGSGPHGSISEPGLLIDGLARSAAVALGDQFGQAAIYEWDEDRLEIIDVRDQRALRLGWRLIESTKWRWERQPGL